MRNLTPLNDFQQSGIKISDVVLTVGKVMLVCRLVIVPALENLKNSSSCLSVSYFGLLTMTPFIPFRHPCPRCDSARNCSCR